MFALTLPDGSRLTWSARGDFAESFLKEIALIAALDELSGETGELSRVHFQDGAPPGGAGYRPVWPNVYQERCLFEERECRFQFFITPALADWARREELNLQRILFFAPFAASILQGDMALLHGVLVEKEGAGMLIAGDSGIGKTTCMQRLGDDWRKHCDDAMVLFRGHDGYYAMPLPTWSRGRAGAVAREKRAVRVKKICLLSRSGHENIPELGLPEKISGFTRHVIYFHYVFRMLSVWPKTHPIQLQGFEFARRVCRELPVLRLDVPWDGEFTRPLNELFHGGGS